jgi:hypothetical protein
MKTVTNQVQTTFNQLKRGNQIHLNARFKASTTEAIQPTKFPNIDYVTWDVPGCSEQHVSIESCQSTKNHMELTLWREATWSVNPLFTGIPYVYANLNGQFFSSSFREPHRMGSAYFTVNPAFKEKLERSMGTPLRTEGSLSMAKAAMLLDFNTLLHGTWLPSFQPKGFGSAGLFRLPGLYTTEIVGVGIRSERGGANQATIPNVSGGVGNVPYNFSDFILSGGATQPLRIDLAKLRSYGLPEPIEDLAIATILWMLSAFLEHTRLRSRCWLDFESLETIKPSGQVTIEDICEFRLGLEEIIQTLIPMAYPNGGDVTAIELNDADLKKAETENKAEKNRDKSAQGTNQSLPEGEEGEE